MRCRSRSWAQSVQNLRPGRRSRPQAQRATSFFAKGLCIPTGLLKLNASNRPKSSSGSWCRHQWPSQICRPRRSVRGRRPINVGCVHPVTSHDPFGIYFFSALCVLMSALIAALIYSGSFGQTVTISANFGSSPSSRTVFAPNSCCESVLKCSEVL